MVAIGGGDYKDSKLGHSKLKDDIGDREDRKVVEKASDVTVAKDGKGREEGRSW